MNKQKWASLSKEVQATIQKVNEEWVEKSGKAWDDFDKAGLETTKAKGLPGDEALKFCQEWLKKNP